MPRQTHTYVALLEVTYKQSVRTINEYTVAGNVEDQVLVSSFKRNDTEPQYNRGHHKKTQIFLRTYNFYMPFENPQTGQMNRYELVSAEGTMDNVELFPEFLAPLQDRSESDYQLMDDLGIPNQPQFIYNLDEKGCRLTLYHGQPVLARRRQLPVNLLTNEQAKNVIIVACMCAGTCNFAYDHFQGIKEEKYLL
ncbi:hypothetical protein ILUMI_25363 [Ignelater luminosus]|uniref:Uncharacterized protein n=1 Tax=Ignelater luminosus TaxID=2038154 RepID=A0A8K0C8K1_IGNLU|nr:hypothetical protein ILUMI_25363 [Ignelater luminosus]